MSFSSFLEAWDSEAIESAAAALLRGWQDPAVEARHHGLHRAAVDGAFCVPCWRSTVVVAVSASVSMLLQSPALVGVSASLGPFLLVLSLGSSVLSSRVQGICA